MIAPVRGEAANLDYSCIRVNFTDNVYSGRSVYLHIPNVPCMSFPFVDHTCIRAQARALVKYEPIHANMALPFPCIRVPGKLIVMAMPNEFVIFHWTSHTRPTLAPSCASWAVFTLVL
jgi:hypothetical protein